MQLEALYVEDRAHRCLTFDHRHPHLCQSMECAFALGAGESVRHPGTNIPTGRRHGENNDCWAPRSALVPFGWGSALLPGVMYLPKANLGSGRAA